MNIDEVLGLACALIDEQGIRQDSLSRVSDYPDLRSFRMYRNQKLVDAPTKKSGVAGVYERKHVLQLAAIKRLQSQCVPLRKIRDRLADAGVSELEAIIGGRVSAGVNSSTKRSKQGPTKSDTRWIQVELTKGAFAMVSVDLLSRSRPSSLRALGEKLGSNLMSLRS